MVRDSNMPEPKMSQCNYVSSATCAYVPLPWMHSHYRVYILGLKLGYMTLFELDEMLFCKECVRVCL